MSDVIAELVIRASTFSPYDRLLLWCHYKGLPTAVERFAFLFRLTKLGALVWCICTPVCGLFSIILGSLVRLKKQFFASELYGDILQWLYEKSAQKEYISYCLRGYRLQKMIAHVHFINAQILSAERSVRRAESAMDDETRRVAYEAIAEARVRRNELAALVDKLMHRSEVAYAFGQARLFQTYDRLGRPV